MTDSISEVSNAQMSGGDRIDKKIGDRSLKGPLCCIKAFSLYWADYRKPLNEFRAGD